MNLLLLSVVASLGLTPVLADSDHGGFWAPAGPGDVRGPCPMLNTLANHNILPHNGKNLTQEITVNALIEGVNFTSDLGKFLFQFAIATNPQQNATWFDLNHLGRHGILEHDASLSRADSFFDPADTFNQAIFDETTSYWKEPLIDLNAAAVSRRARVITSAKTNPAFTYTPVALGFAYGEVAAYLLVFGGSAGRKEGKARKDLVEWFFENERLPTSLGWKTPSPAISNLDLCQMSQRVINATGTTQHQAEAILPCSDFDA